MSAVVTSFCRSTKHFTPRRGAVTAPSRHDIDRPHALPPPRFDDELTGQHGQSFGACPTRQCADELRKGARIDDGGDLDASALQVERAGVGTVVVGEHDSARSWLD